MKFLPFHIMTKDHRLLIVQIGLPFCVELASAFLIMADKERLDGGAFSRLSASKDLSHTVKSDLPQI